MAGLAVIYGRFVRTISKQTQDALAQATQVGTSSLCPFHLGAIVIILLSRDHFIGLFSSALDPVKVLTTFATHLHLSNMSLVSWTEI